MGWTKGKPRKPRPPRVIVDGNGSGDGVTVVPGADGVVIDGTATVIDPASIGNDGADDGGRSEPPKSRRTGGGRRTTSKKKDPVSVSAIETLLYSCHNMLAAMTQVEELQMTEEEAHKLAAAAAKVADQYEDVPGMSEKAAAWTNLIMVAGSAYVPRAASFAARMKLERGK